MSISTSESMIKKSVKLLDGTRAKIIGALSTSYKLDNGGKISARKLLSKGRGFVETEMTMRDLEDSGEGYVVVKSDDKPAKSTKRSGSKRTSSKRTGSKRTGSKKTTGSRRSRKKTEEAVEEKPARTRGKKRVRKSSEPKVDKRIDLVFDTDEEISKIRQALELSMREILSGSYRNVENIVCESSRSENNPETAELRCQVFVNLPAPDHHCLDYYLAIAREAGATIKAPGARIQERLAQALQLEDDDSFVLEPGAILVDTENRKFVFGGLNNEIKRSILVDLADEQVVEAGLRAFDGLDYFGNFNDIIQDTIEAFEARKAEQEEPTDEFDLDDSDVPSLNSLPFGEIPQEQLVSMVVANYSREQIEEFILNHKDLEAGEDDLELETEELVALMVSVLSEADTDDFDEDAVDDDAMEDDDSLEDEDYDDSMEDADDELSDEEAADYGPNHGLTEANVLHLRTLLLEDEMITKKGNDRMCNAEIVELYTNTYGELPEFETSEIEEAQEVSVDEMAAALVEAEELTPKMASRMSEEQITELYNEVFGNAELDEDDDSLEDEDADDMDDDSLEDDDSMEDDEDDMDDDVEEAAQEEFDDELV